MAGPSSGARRLIQSKAPAKPQNYNRQPILVKAQKLQKSAKKS